MKKQLCLTADIGGTNTRVALFDNEKLLESSCVTYSNNEYDSLRDDIRNSDAFNLRSKDFEI